MTPPSLAATASLTMLDPGAVMCQEDRHADVLTLASAPPGVPFAVHRLSYPASGAEWPQRLEELGFLPGERVMVLTRGWPGGDPIAVRIGQSCFALRRAEGDCVEVRPGQP